MELINIEVDLPRRRLKVEPLNRRFVKLGFAKLEAIKRDSLPIMEYPSPLRRYRTEKTEERQQSYFNEFWEWSNEEQLDSLSSLKAKKHVQPLCMYKKPRIRDNPFSFRKKLLPKMGDQKLNQSEDNEHEVVETTKSNVRQANVSTVSFNEQHLITFYPNKKLIS